MNPTLIGIIGIIIMLAIFMTRMPVAYTSSEVADASIRQSFFQS